MPNLTYPASPRKAKAAAVKGPSSIPKEKKGPYTLDCGCNALGKRCPEEERLGEYLDDCRAAFLRSDALPGQLRFGRVYGALLDARRDYQAHFGHRYFPEYDDLWQEHRAAVARGTTR